MPYLVRLSVGIRRPRPKAGPRAGIAHPGWVGNIVSPPGSQVRNGRDLIFITRDKRIRRDKNERSHLSQSTIKAVLLTSIKNSDKAQMAELIERHWYDIVNEVGSRSGPSLVVTDPTG